MTLHFNVVSDSHLTPAVIESESYFPHYIRTLPPLEQQRFFDQLQGVMRHAFVRCLEGVSKEDPAFIVHTGDVTGGHKERGTLHETIDAGKDARRQMEAIAPSYICWGNHDTGYGRRGTVAGAGITREGVEGCLEAYGEPAWERKDGGLLSLGIASPLDEYEGADPELNRLREDQRTFIADTLQANRNDPWVLFTHDPLSIDALHAVFTPHIEHNKGMIYGDLHMPAGETLLGIKRWLTKLHPTTHTLIKQSALCPSTAPLGWRGYTYLAAEYKAGRLAVEQREAPMGGMPTNPAASTLKGAYMLIHSKIHSTNKEGS